MHAYACCDCSPAPLSQQTQTQRINLRKLPYALSSIDHACLPLGSLRQAVADSAGKVRWNAVQATQVLELLRRSRDVEYNDGFLRLCADLLVPGIHEMDANPLSKALGGLRRVKVSATHDSAHVQKLVDAIAETLRKKQIVWSRVQLSTAMNGLCNMSSDHASVQHLLTEITAVIQRSPVVTLDERSIGTILYGMQNLSSEHAATRKLVAAVATAMSKSQPEMTVQGWSNAMYGLRSLSTDHHEVRHLLGALAKFPLVANAQLAEQSFGSALYGLQRMEDVAPVRRLLRTLCKACHERPVDLDGQAVSNALFGLQRMSSAIPEVKDVLWIMTKSMRRSGNVTLNALEIANALYGLRNMDHAQSDVRELLRTLTTAIETSPARLAGKNMCVALYSLKSMKRGADTYRLLEALYRKFAVWSQPLIWANLSMALYGMQGLESDAYTVRALLDRFEHVIRQQPIQEDPDGLAVAMCLGGFQSMKCGHPEVRRLLRFLMRKFEKSTATLDGAQLGIAIFGLQSCSDDVEEVRQVAKFLAERVRHSELVLASNEVGSVFYGLQGLTDTHPEVCALLDALADVLTRSDVVLDDRSIGNTFFGLQRKTRSPATFRLLNAMREKLYSSNIERLSQTCVTQALRGLFGIQGEVASELRAFFVEKLDPASLTPVTDVHGLVAIMRVSGLELPPQVEACYRESTKKADSYYLTETAHKMADQIRAQYPGTVLLSEVLDGFEMDIYLPELKLDIELDGAHHERPAKAEWDRIRDGYLRDAHGVVTTRIVLAGLTDDAMLADVLQAINARQLSVGSS